MRCLTNFRAELKLSTSLYEKQPQEELRHKIEALHLKLQSLFLQLAPLQKKARIKEIYTENNAVEQEISVLDWEDVADESGAEDDEDDVPGMTEGGAPDGASSYTNIPQIDDLSYLQNRKLVLLSNLNADPQYSKDELSIRQEQASGELNHLRDLITEKSFQYSGVIRVGRKHMKLVRAHVGVHPYPLSNPLRTF